MRHIKCFNVKMSLVYQFILIPFLCFEANLECLIFCIDQCALSIHFVKKVNSKFSLSHLSLAIQIQV